MSRKLHHATFKVIRPSKGAGQISILNCYDKDGKLIASHTGRKARLARGPLDRMGLVRYG